MAYSEDPYRNAKISAEKEIALALVQRQQEGDPRTASLTAHQLPKAVVANLVAMALADTDVLGALLTNVGVRRAAILVAEDGDLPQGVTRAALLQLPVQAKAKLLYQLSADQLVDAVCFADAGALETSVTAYYSQILAPDVYCPWCDLRGAALLICNAWDHCGGSEGAGRLGDPSLRWCYACATTRADSKIPDPGEQQGYFCDACYHPLCHHGETATTAAHFRCTCPTGTCVECGAKLVKLCQDLSHVALAGSHYIDGLRMIMHAQQSPNQGRRCTTCQWQAEVTGPPEDWNPKSDDDA